MKNKSKNSSGLRIRFNKAERHQREFRDICLDELVADDHQVRSVWSYVCSLNLSQFESAYQATEGRAGRKPVDPRILLTIWLFATIEGISSGRRLAELCKRDAVFMWICGNVGVNHNLLNTFRVAHLEALQDLMTQTIALLQHNGLIDFKRISQDGVRVRANAGKSSFRREESLKELLKTAEQEVTNEVTNEGTDSGQMEPMLDQIESDFGERPQEMLADGGYNSKEDITAVQQSGTTVFSPVRKARKSDKDPHERHPGDSDEVAAWRERMKTESAQEIYHERCSTAEFPFARFRNHGLYQFPVRGIRKAKAVSLWHALVHNFQQIMTNNWMSAVTG